MKRWTMHSHGMDAIDATNVDDPRDDFTLNCDEEFVLMKDHALVVALLRKAREILDEHRVTEDGEYNNEEVTDVCERIDRILTR